MADMAETVKLRAELVTKLNALATRVLQACERVIQDSCTAADIEAARSLLTTTGGGGEKD